MANILIIYSTTDGHTRTICRQLQQYLHTLDTKVEVVAVEEVAARQLSDCDKIIVGASIRYGKHHERVYQLVKNHQQALEARPNAFFSVNLVARKPEKRSPETNPYVRKFLGQISWRPQKLEIFAGKLDYPRYGRMDRFVIRLIMRITGGPTDPQTTIEFTDWDRVEAFAREFDEMGR